VHITKHSQIPIEIELGRNVRIREGERGRRHGEMRAWVGKSLLSLGGVLVGDVS
jgi:hypothetical protein